MRLALSGLLFDHAPAAEFAAAAREIGYAGVELRGTRNQLPPDADAARVDAALVATAPSRFGAC